MDEWFSVKSTCPGLPTQTYTGHLTGRISPLPAHLLSPETMGKVYRTGFFVLEIFLIFELIPQEKFTSMHLTLFLVNLQLPSCKVIHVNRDSVPIAT